MQSGELQLGLEKVVLVKSTRAGARVVSAATGCSYPHAAVAAALSAAAADRTSRLHPPAGHEIRPLSHSQCPALYYNWNIKCTRS